MKNWFLICLLSGFFLMSCDENGETVYSVDPALSPQVERFYVEASSRSVEIPKNLSVVVQDTQSEIKIEKNGNQYVMYYSPELLKNQTEQQKQAVICFYLGKMYLNRKNDETKFSFMNYFLRAGYDPADEAALFDELFN